MIDMYTLEPGQDSDKLPETYVIWITEKDVYYEVLAEQKEEKKEELRELEIP